MKLSGWVFTTHNFGILDFGILLVLILFLFGFIFSLFYILFDLIWYIAKLVHSPT